MFYNIKNIKESIAHGYFLASIKEFSLYIEQGITSNHQAIDLHRSWFTQLQQHFVSPNKTTLPELDHSLCFFSNWFNSLEAKLILHASISDKYDMQGNILLIHRNLHQQAQYVHTAVRQQNFFDAHNHFNELINQFLLLDKHISQAQFNFLKSPKTNFIKFILSEIKSNQNLDYYFVIHIDSLIASDIYYQEQKETLDAFMDVLSNTLHSEGIDFIYLEHEQRLHIVINTRDNNHNLVIENALNEFDAKHSKYNQKQLCIKTFALADLPTCQFEHFESMLYNMQSMACINTVNHLTKKELVDHFEFAVKDLSLIDRVKQHIKTRNFKIFYQPIVNKEGEYQSAEALIRMPHKNNHNFLDAKDFLKLAEEHHLTLEIDQLVFSLLKQDIPKLSRITPMLNVNIYPGSLNSYNFVEQIKELNQTCKQHQLKLIIELTEHDALTNKEVLETLSKNEGIKFAIDDFGTGYSNLAVLLELAEKQIVQQAKLDGEMINNIDIDVKKLQMIKFITDMAINLNLQPVIAEFIDSSEKVDLLDKLPSHILYQGFFFSKAKSVDSLIKEKGLGT